MVSLLVVATIAPIWVLILGSRLGWAYWYFCIWSAGVFVIFGHWFFLIYVLCIGNLLARGAFSGPDYNQPPPKWFRKIAERFV